MLWSSLRAKSVKTVFKWILRVNCSIFRVVGPYLKPLLYILNNLFMNRVESWNKFGHEPSQPMTLFIPQAKPDHKASRDLQVGFFVNLVLNLCHLNPRALVFVFFLYSCTWKCIRTKKTIWQWNNQLINFAELWNKYQRSL